MKSYEAKEWLGSYKGLHEEYEMVENSISNLKSPGFEERRGHGSKTINDAIMKLDSIEQQMSGIERAIDSLPYPYERIILHYHFIDFKTMEEVGRITGYSMSQIYRIYNQAIRDISKMEVNGSE